MEDILIVSVPEYLKLQLIYKNESPLDILRQLNTDMAELIKKQKFDYSPFGKERGYEYRRNQINQFATPFGVFQTVLLEFPDFQTTVPHSHPFLLAETVIDGSIQELQFERNGRGRFDYTGYEVFREGHQIVEKEDHGRPHAVRGFGGPARVVASFCCGGNSMRVIDPSEICNIRKIPKPFAYFS